MPAIMLQTFRAYGGMVTAPHHLAAEAGRDVLKDGGNAVEAAIATAACLAVVYPHMTAIGGDGFWLIARPGEDPVAIDASGRAGGAATIERYRGMAEIPWRGPLAANTVAGTISGWQAALAWAGGRLPLERLLEPAIHYAESGFPVTCSQEELTRSKLAEVKDVAGFAAQFLDGGKVPAAGSRMRLPALGATLRRLGRDGLDGFYRGSLGRQIAAELGAAGALVGAEDLAAHQPVVGKPLTVALRRARLFNCRPPSQGLASLMILALFERLGVKEAEGFAFVHGLVEATKQAFLVRERAVCDPDHLPEDPQNWLKPDRLDRLAARIDPGRALPWPAPPQAGDTVWMGAIDRDGNAASFIQSIYFEFGSGIVLPETGIAWQNRGSSFKLDPQAPNALAPGRKPFHTLNPAMARFADDGMGVGRTMVYGTMGGEGQPQTQAAIFARHALFGQDLQASVTAPRWLLGRTWGEQSVTLKLEDRFDPALVAALRAAGHEIEILPAFTATMGHAGAIVRHPDGLLEGATDPRSDGAVGAF